MNSENQEIMIEEIINSMFVTFLNSNIWERDDKSQILIYYAEYLFEKQRYLKAIEIMASIDEKSLGFFTRRDFQAVKLKFDAHFSRIIYFDNYEKKLRIIDELDFEIGYMNK